MAIHMMKIAIIIREAVKNYSYDEEEGKWKCFFFMMRRIATQQWRNLISEGVVAGPQMFDEKQICGARPEISITMGSSS